MHTNEAEMNNAVLQRNSVADGAETVGNASVEVGADIRGYRKSLLHVAPKTPAQIDRSGDESQFYVLQAGASSA